MYTHMSTYTYMYMYVYIVCVLTNWEVFWGTKYGVDNNWYEGGIQAINWL